MKQPQYRIGCDAHKHCSLFAVLDHRGRPVEQIRVNHEPGAIRAFVSRFPPGMPVALETVGNWYSRKDTGTVWIVDEIEQAGCVPHLAHAQMAKKMMGHVHTRAGHLRQDGQAPRGRAGYPPAPGIASHRLDRPGRDPKSARAAPHPDGALQAPHHAQEPHAFHPGQVGTLPGHPERCLRPQMALEAHATHPLFSQRNPALHGAGTRTAGSAAGADPSAGGSHPGTVADHPTIQLIQSVPGPAEILSILIDREAGSIERFPSCNRFASYSGATPKVKASGRKTHHGKMTKAANNYLRWAFRVASRSVAEGHRSRYRRRPPTAPPQLAPEVRRRPL